MSLTNVTWIVRLIWARYLKAACVRESLKLRDKSHTTPLKLQLFDFLQCLSLPLASRSLSFCWLLLDLIARWVDHYFDPTRNQFFWPAAKISRCLFLLQTSPLLHYLRFAQFKMHQCMSSTSTLSFYVIIHIYQSLWFRGFDFHLAP